MENKNAKPLPKSIPGTVIAQDLEKHRRERQAKAKGERNGEQSGKA